MYRFAGRFERPVLGWGVCKVLSQNKPLVSQRGAWPGDHEEDSLSVHTLESASKSLTKLDIYEAGSGTKIADLLLIGLSWCAYLNTILQERRPPVCTILSLFV